MTSKTLSTILIFMILIIAFPFFIGLLGGAFGIVMGIFGAVIGVVTGVIGAMAGIIGGFFKLIFGFGFFGWNFFALLFVTAILILITKKSR